MLHKFSIENDFFIFIFFNGKFCNLVLAEFLFIKILQERKIEEWPKRKIEGK